MRKALAVLQKDKKIIYCKGYTNYATIASYSALLRMCKSTNHSLFELIFADKPVPLFFDLEAKNIEYDRAILLFDTFSDQLTKCFPDFEKKIYTLESHGALVDNIFQKYSLHIVCRFFDKQNGNELLFANVCTVKKYVEEMFDSELIDVKVYREGLFRCIYSGKPRELTRVLRPVGTYADETMFFILNHCTNYAILPYTVKEVEPTAESDFIELVGSTEKVKDKSNDRTNLQNLSEWFKAASRFYLEQAGFKNIIKTFKTSYNKQTQAFITEYKGSCPFKGNFHDSNNTRVILGQSNVTVKCYDQNCGAKVYKTPPALQPFFDPTQLLPIVCDVINCKDKGVSPSDITLASEGVFKASASDLCEVEDAVTHKLSTFGYSVDCTDNVKDFGNDFHLYNVLNNINLQSVQLVNNVSITNNIRHRQPCLVGDTQYFEVKSFNAEQQIAFNDWLRCPGSYCFFQLFKCTHYANNYVTSKNILYRYNGVVWTDTEVKEHFTDDTYAILKEILNNTTAYKDDLFLWPFLIKKQKEATEMAGNKQFAMLTKLCSLESQGVQFDSNYNILPFKNGVYDLNLKVFRAHSASDYITKTLTFDYDPLVTNTALETFFEQVMPEFCEREYLLFTLATLLYSNTANDHMYFFIGKGCNGKSLLLRLVALTLGPFANKISENMFTTHALTPSQARPELIELKNSKVAILTDPKINTMCSSTVKNLAGNETMIARGLYAKKQEAVVVSAKFIISMNSFPTFTENDHATKRRLRFIMFHSSFVDDPIAENEFKINEKLMEIIQSDITWVQAFVNKLIAIDISKPVKVPDAFKKDLVYVGAVDLNSFLLENLRQRMGSFVSAKEIIDAFTDEPLHPKSRKYKQHYATIHNFILITFPSSRLVKRVCNGQQIRGWPCLYLKELD